MKKFFKKITKNPSKDSAPPGSPQLGAGAQPIPDIGYDVREKDLPKLHKAAWTGDIAKVKQYVKKDCSALDKENRTALHLACVHGHAGVVQELLEWHAKTNIGDNDSKTPLIKAVECNQDECVMLLLEHRGDVDASDRDGDSSLHIAVRNGYTNIVKVLLRNGATIDKKNKEGCTPLHIACKGKKPEIIRILLFDSKASVDVTDVNGRTPLMLASYDGSVTAVQLLLECKANTMIKDSKGFTAEDIAMMTAQHGCCQLIRDYNMKLRRSVSGASSTNTTPRSSMGMPSATPTPRDNTITPEFGLPIQQQSDDESGDEDVSKLSTGGDFDHSWGDDTDMSLSVGDKKGKDLPKINLAHALSKSLPRDNVSDDGGGGDEGGARGQPSPRTPVSKQDSNKSLHSQTSIEDNWSDDEEMSQNLSRKSNTPRVTWREGNQLSETHVITGDEGETTDDDDYKVTAKKRQKLDQGGNTQQQSMEQGYTPTGVVSDKPSVPISSEQHKESSDLRASKQALMEDLGLSDVSDTDSEDVEFPSEVSDHLLDARVPTQQQPVFTPIKQASVEETQEEDSIANSEHLTPRPGILKNWKQHSKELAEQNKSQLSQRSDDVSEWDSDLENELDPEKSISGNEGSNWDSSADVTTPRNPVITQTVATYLPGGDEEEEDDNVDEVDYVEEVPLETVNAAIQEAAALDAVSIGTVDSNQSAGTSGSKPETVREVVQKVGQDKDQDDDDSEWDSEEEVMSEEQNASTHVHEHPLPHNSVSPRSRQDSEDETEEISEWEIERQREKEERQRLEEEEERLKEEERVRQMEWEEDERRKRERERKLAEEEEFEMRLEEEEMEEEMRKEEEESLRREAEEEAAALEREKAAALEREKAVALEREKALALEREKVVPIIREVEHKQIDLQQLKQIRLNQEAAERRQELFEQPDDVSSDEELAGDHFTSPVQPSTMSVTSPKRELKTCNFLSVNKFFKDEKKEAVPSYSTAPQITATNTYQLSSQRTDQLSSQRTDQLSSQRTVPKKEEAVEEVQEDVIVQSVKSPGLQYGVPTPVKEEKTVPSTKSPGLRFSPVPTPTMEMARQKGPEATKPLETPAHPPPPPQFTSVSPPTRSEALPQHKSPTSRPSPTNPTRLKMSLQSDGNSIDEDDSDLEPDRSDMGTYLKNLPTSYSYAPYKGLDLPDDDMLSFTSTENGENSTYTTTNIPYGKDVLANMNLSDPNTVIKLQDHLRDQRKMLDHERNQRLTIESKNKSLSKERNEMQKKIDTLNQQRTSLEQAKLDLEQRIRTIEYSLNEEVEMRKNADILLNKTKEQLARKEEQYTSEMEGRQKAELQIRNMQMEIRTATSAVKQLEDEKETLTRQYQHEKNARQLQEQLNEEQQRLQHQLHTEQVKAATQKTDAENRFEVADEDRKYTHDHLEKARAELSAMKMELDRQRSRFKDENALLSSENEELQRKIEDLKTEIKLNEDALAHATVQYNLQISNSRSEVNVLNGVVERERLAREKGDAQLESAKNRLHSAAMELEKSEQARNELERRYHDDKESWEVTKEQKQREVQDLQEQNQTVVRRSHAIEAKLTSVENEFHIVSANLMEKSNLYNQTAKDLQYYKSAQENYDQNYQVEKEHNVKLTVKIENLQEKNTGLQHDNLSLKQQLETAQQALADRAADTGQERFTTILASLKSEQDKSRMALEERNSSLTEATSRLREEVRNSEARRTQLEQELNRMNRDYNDLIRKLSVAEASLEMAQKSKDSLEQERGQLKLEVDRLHQKYEMAHEKSIESQARITEMVDRLERSEQNNLYSSQQILNNSANMEAFSRTKEELEDSMQKIQVDNVKLQAELSHEKQRAEMLQKDLQDSQRVRSSLEELCSNLKSSKAQLEDKLGREQGLDIVQYEKQRQEAVSQLEEEKRKCRKVMELKKTAEGKYEAEHEKNVQLQTEIASLKSYLKSAKKRLKSRVENGYVEKEELEQVRKEIEARYRLELNRKLDEVNSYLEDQARSREKLDNSRDETDSKLKQINKKLQDETTALRIKYEQILAQKESKDMEAKRYRDLYESEMQWRMRLSEQLMKSTDRAFSYKTNAERQKSRLYNSTGGNVSFSGVLNGQLLDSTRFSGTGDDILGNKLKAELDRSIAKHLEAGPHDNIKPLISNMDDHGMSSSFAKSNSDYLELLKRKYCV